jgi:hypothetical protein
MVPSFNFVPVLHSMAEPERGLWIFAHAGREYEHNQFEIVVEQDPELRPGRLLRPTTEEFKADWRQVNPVKQPPEWEPNRSPASTTLVSFWVDHSLQNGEVQLVMRKEHKNLGQSAARLKQALDLPSLESGFELIQEALKASIELPAWDYQAQIEVRDLQSRLISGPPRAKIALYLEPELASELAENSSLRFQAGAGDMLLADRDARLI